jgi:tRNA(fMet)-specific endonuclease VapC
MIYMIETDWAVHYLRGREKFIDRFHELREDGVGLSIISLAELYTGIYYSTDLSKARENLDNFLSFVTVLGVNDGICQIFGEENARLKKEGFTIDDLDLLIGATCVYHGLKLLTNNRRHFNRINGIEIISI